MSQEFEVPLFQEKSPIKQHDKIVFDPEYFEMEGDDTLEYVYLMQDRFTGLIKIGFSKNPAARESTLFSEKPHIEMIAYYPGSRYDEHKLHKEFKYLRIRGEWFVLDDFHLRVIENYFGGDTGGSILKDQFERWHTSASTGGPIHE